MGAVILDALSGLANIPSSAPRLLFHTRWIGMAIDAGHSEGSLKDWHQDFTDSVDSVTGSDIVADLKTLWGSNLEVDILSIPQADVSTSGELATYFGTNLASDQLSLEILDSHGDYPTYTGVPQTMVSIRRNAAQALAGDIDEVCFSGRFKLPATLDLSGNNSAGEYLTCFEGKAGGYNGIGGIGDFRIQVMINNGVPGYHNEWKVQVDNSANGVGVIPSLPTLEVYYSPHTNMEAQLDVCTRYYVYWHRSAGRLVVAIQVDGSATQILANIHPEDLPAKLNGLLYGLEGLPITRIHPCMMYATGGYPTVVPWADLQVWDKLPVNIA